ncbi:LPXTG cell wall anchor domain-containing protein [Streptomyces sp. NPDC052225]
MTEDLFLPLARGGVTGPQLPTWLLIVIIVGLISLGLYGISRKRKGR